MGVRMGYTMAAPRKVAKRPPPPPSPPLKQPRLDTNEAKRGFGVLKVFDRVYGAAQTRALLRRVGVSSVENITADSTWDVVRLAAMHPPKQLPTGDRLNRHHRRLQRLEHRDGLRAIGELASKTEKAIAEILQAPDKAAERIAEVNAKARLESDREYAAQRKAEERKRKAEDEEILKSFEALPEGLRYISADMEKQYGGPIVVPWTLINAGYCLETTDEGAVKGMKPCDRFEFTTILGVPCEKHPNGYRGDEITYPDGTVEYAVNYKTTCDSKTLYTGEAGWGTVCRRADRSLCIEYLGEGTFFDDLGNVHGLVIPDTVIRSVYGRAYDSVKHIRDWIPSGSKAQAQRALA